MKKLIMSLCLLTSVCAEDTPQGRMFLEAGDVTLGYVKKTAQGEYETTATFLNAASVTTLELTGVTSSLKKIVRSFPNLTKLKIHNGSLGMLVNEIGALTKLTHLELVNCGLTGVIPASIENLKNLKYLSLVRNKLEGDLPETFFSMQGLTHVYLNNNQLTGEVKQGAWLKPGILEKCDFTSNKFSFYPILTSRKL